MAQTHTAIGVSWWLGISVAVRPGPLPVLAGAAVAGLLAVAPDIDKRKTEAARSLPPVTTALAWGLSKCWGGHRGITHSAVGVAGMAVLAAAGWLLTGVSWWVPAAVMTGWCSHLAADMATRSGIAFAWPDLTPWYWLPKPWRVTTGLMRKRLRGSRRKKHTAEWWLVRPAAVASCLILAGLVVAGW